MNALNQDRLILDLAVTSRCPLRGCGFARCGGISFDPAGIFSFCCESPRGLGWIRQTCAEQCLSLLDESARNRPCRACPYFQLDLCRGCWTGQKCGMVNYWGAKSCRALHAGMVRGGDHFLSGPLHPQPRVG